MVVIVVVAAVMVYAWATGLLSSLLVQNPVPKETLALDSSAFGGGTPTNNVTLYIRNSGSVAVSLVTYYAKDSTGDSYSFSWASASQPSINPGAVSAGTLITINTSCSSCVLSGSAFQFAAGNAYTITVVTSRSNQFSFSLTK